jgi:pectate lyase C
VEVTGGIRCDLQNFDMKAPFPDVGRNGCWWEPVTSRDYVPEKKKAAVSAPVAGVAAITGANCESTGIVTVENTITVAGSTYDGKCKTFLAGAGLKHAGADRSLDRPIFNVTNGATLRNAIIGDKQNDSGAGGVHVTNGGTVDNVSWVKAPVSALTVHPTKAKVIVRNLTAPEGAEQFILVNGEADVNVSNCIVAKSKRFASQKAGSSAKVVLLVDRCKLDELKEGVFRSDSPVSEAAISNSKLIKTGELCMGKWGSCGETVTQTKK